MLVGLILVLFFVLGVMLTFLGYHYGQRALENYRQRVLSRVNEGLQSSFIFVTERRMIGLCGAGIVAGIVVGYIVASYPGAVIGSSAAAAAPYLLMRVVVARRRDRFIYQLPDGLRALAGSLRAGGTPVRGIELIAQRQPDPLAQEFGLVLAQHKLGRDLNEALEDMYERMQCDELRLVNSAIRISRSVGGNLADSLEALAQTLQSKAQVEGKIKALTSMGRMQGWVVGMLPIAVGYVLYLQRPEDMSKLFTTPMGWVALVVIAVLMLAAALTIRKIVNIDV